MSYRSLRNTEIEQLEAQGCTASDWSRVQADDRFSPEWIRHVHFSGEIRLGVFDKESVQEGGFCRHTGIYNATLHNCHVGDNAYIAHIDRYIANYHIGREACIEHADLIATIGRTSFGNGTAVNALNEAGGREVVIYDRLSAQTAYLLCLYRHHPQAVSQLERLIGEYAISVSSETGTIGDRACIRSCKIIRNVRIGSHAVLEGVSLLDNGSVSSCAQAPTFVGNDVSARNFILSTGSRITEGCQLENCFVGQGTQLGKQFSLYDSLLFANCQGFHGEACSIFGGPYTVTHHKSTLLIAGMFSFMNAGSASNQSNHLYKLGPTQQGILARGCKTTSGSYLLWPAHIGVFTLIKGKHYDHPDTSDMPFSYLLESEGKSYLLPGANLCSCGLARDAAKWGKRDLREDSDLLDGIHFSIFNPHSMGCLLRGYEALTRLAKVASENYPYNGTQIPAKALHKGIRYYQTALHIHIGNQLIDRLKNLNRPFGESELSSLLRPTSYVGQGDWADMAGTITPLSEINRLIGDLESGQITSLTQVEGRMRLLYSQYAEYAWSWTYRVWQRMTGMDMPGRNEVIRQLDAWQDAIRQLAEWRIADARKEYNDKMKTGYGMDGHSADREADFMQVRGDFEHNGFVVQTQAELHEALETAHRLHRQIEAHA